MNKKGYALGILLIVVIVVIFGFLGFVVYEDNIKTSAGEKFCEDKDMEFKLIQDGFAKSHHSCIQIVNEQFTEREIDNQGNQWGFVIEEVGK